MGFLIGCDRGSLPFECKKKFLSEGRETNHQENEDEDGNCQQAADRNVRIKRHSAARERDQGVPGLTLVALCVVARVGAGVLHAACSFVCFQIVHGSYQHQDSEQAAHQSCSAEGKDDTNDFLHERSPSKRANFIDLLAKLGLALGL